MGPRRQFVLIYSDEAPVSADIIREDSVEIEDEGENGENVKLQIGTRVKFQWVKSKEEKQTDTGVVLEIGA